MSTWLVAEAAAEEAPDAPLLISNEAQQVEGTTARPHRLAWLLGTLALVAACWAALATGLAPSRRGGLGGQRRHLLQRANLDGVLSRKEDGEEFAPVGEISPEGLAFVGCFMKPPPWTDDIGAALRARASGSTTVCSQECAGQTCMAVGNYGQCACGVRASEFKDFMRVSDPYMCGPECPGEYDLVPKRYCGNMGSWAVYCQAMPSTESTTPALDAQPSDADAELELTEETTTTPPTTTATTTATTTTTTTTTTATTTTIITPAPTIQTNPTTATTSAADETSADTLAETTDDVTDKTSDESTDEFTGIPTDDGELVAPTDIETTSVLATESTSAETPTTTTPTTTATTTTTVTTTPWKRPIKGVCYAPVPMKAGNGRLPQDDFMGNSTRVLWSSGPTSRGDLRIIRRLGANAVRLYGNNPELNHREFLDEAHAQGLQVIAGLSDYPYVQMPGSCSHTDHDCYNQIKDQYKQNLYQGFALNETRMYHPALRTVILMNEADLKFQPITDTSLYSKALVSAFDAVLDAEKELGIVGPKPNFTATMSFGVCGYCKHFKSTPGLGQMAALSLAMLDPSSVGYTPRNNIWEAYRSRFENSVNTANPARGPGGFKSLFLDAYDLAFPSMPLFVGEYHAPNEENQEEDLKAIMEIVEDQSNMLQGISFFEFQIQYYKGGSEMAFGMFGLGPTKKGSFQMGDQDYSAWCLSPSGKMRKVQHCGLIDGGVDYVVASDDGVYLDHVKSPSDCCKKCTESGGCLSWSWSKDGSDACTPSPDGSLRHKAVLPTGQGCGEVAAEIVRATGVPLALARAEVAEEFPAACSSCKDTTRCWLRSGLPLTKELKGGYVSGLPGAVSFLSQLTWEDTLPAAVTSAFGGPGPESGDLCQPSVPLIMEHE